jgi:hypothetical protein
MAETVKPLTEEELCELAEIRNRLAQLLFSADDSQVSEKDLLYVLLLDMDGLRDMMSEVFEEEDAFLEENDLIDPEDIEDEVSIESE